MGLDASTFLLRAAGFIDPDRDLLLSLPSASAQNHPNFILRGAIDCTNAGNAPDTEFPNMLFFSPVCDTIFVVSRVSNWGEGPITRQLR